MKRLITAAAAITLALLTGCATGPKERQLYHTKIDYVRTDLDVIPTGAKFGLVFKFGPELKIADLLDGMPMMAINDKGMDAQDLRRYYTAAQGVEAHKRFVGMAIANDDAQMGLTERYFWNFENHPVRTPVNLLAAVGGGLFLAEQTGVMDLGLFGGVERERAPSQITIPNGERPTVAATDQSVIILLNGDQTPNIVANGRSVVRVELSEDSTIARNNALTDAAIGRAEALQIFTDLPDESE